MPHLPTLLLAVLPLLTSLATAAHLSVHVRPPTTPQSSLFSASSLPASTHATLHASGAPLSAPISRRSTFEFAAVPAGSYLLEVHCREFAFEPVRVDVAEQGGLEWVRAWQTFRGNEWENKGEERGKAQSGAPGEAAKADVYVGVLGAKEYYTPRESFSALSLLKNPMILIAIFSLGMIVGVPYLLENMDPETKAEFEAMQKERSKGSSGSNAAAAVQNFDLAGWMAGSKTGGSGAEVAEVKAEGGRRKG